MSDYTLPRAERLRSLKAIRRLFSEGRSGFVYPFRYIYFAEADLCASAKLLFSVPKRFHKRANKRNLLRRRTKEAYRLNRELLVDGIAASIDLALVYSSKDRLEYQKIERSVKKILQQVRDEVAAEL